MTTDTTTTPPEAGMKANWRDRMREIGKEAFIKEEMERLGFWPPAEGVTQQIADAEAKLKELYPGLQAARSELQTLDKEINLSRNIPALILDIRKKRIERVRAARGVKKQQKEAEQATRQEQVKEWRANTLPYLGHGVSAGLWYEGGDASKVEGASMPALRSAEELASAMGLETKQLAWLTYHRGATVIDHYAHFSIPKRSGGMRAISAPKRQLRTAQSWVLTNILNRVNIHDAAMAFRPKRFILHNAQQHTGKNIVVRVDLKDFFPSIQFRRVKGLFTHLGYNEGVSSILALLCTEAPRVALTLDGQKKHVAIGERQLPQGACTSPAITNILCRRLDSRLTGIAKRYGFTYTRYADDLVFSHADKEAPTGMLFIRLRQIIAEEGYTINDAKTRVMRPQHRQVVTGVVVNETPRLSRRDLRTFRAFLHHCETEGLQTMSEKIGKNALLYANGYLSFLHMVNPEQAQKLRQRHVWLNK